MWNFDDGIALAIQSLKDLREHYEEQVMGGSYDPRSNLPNPVDAMVFLNKTLVFLYDAQLAVRNAAEKENEHA